MELALPDSADFPQDPALVKSDYALTSWQIFRACMEREVLLVDRNRPLYVIRFIMLLVLALVTATLFIRTRMKPTSVVDGNLYFGGLLLAPFRKTLAGLAHSPKEIAWQGWWGGEGGGGCIHSQPHEAHLPHGREPPCLVTFIVPISSERNQQWTQCMEVGGAAVVYVTSGRDGLCLLRGSH